MSANEEKVEAQLETPEERSIAPWAKGDHLRKVEAEVLIPNLMKKKAKVICREYMQAFDSCSKGRLISLAWACRGQLNELKQCISKELEKPELYEESRQEYLATRENFQSEYVKTGKIKQQKKKESVI